jgi:GntR family transcriptional regulator
MQSSQTALDASPALDKRSPVPLYHQLRTVLQQKIESGELRPSDRLPSEDAIASHYKVSKITVRQALLELDQAGLVKRYQGRGTFIAKQRVEQGPRKLSSFSAEMKLRGLSATSRVLEQSVVRADNHLAAKLELEEGEPIFVIKRLRLASGEPMGIQTAHLPLTLVPGIESEVFADASLYEVLQRRYNLRPASARETHFAIALEKQDAELLGLHAGIPALAAERLTRLANGRLLEYVESVMAADRYKIVLHLTDL